MDDNINRMSLYANRAFPFFPPQGLRSAAALCILICVVCSRHPHYASAWNTCEGITRCSECIWDPTDGMLPPFLQCGWCVTTGTCVDLSKDSILSESMADAPTTVCSDLRTRASMASGSTPSCPDMFCSASRTTNNIYFCRPLNLVAVVFAFVLLIITGAVYGWYLTIRQLPWRFEPYLSESLQAIQEAETGATTVIVTTGDGEDVGIRKTSTDDCADHLVHTDSLQGRLALLLPLPSSENSAGVYSKEERSQEERCHRTEPEGNSFLVPTERGGSKREDGEAQTTTETATQHRRSDASSTVDQLTCTNPGSCSPAGCTTSSPSAALPPAATTSLCPICKVLQPAGLGVGEVCFWCGVARLAFMPLFIGLGVSVGTILLLFSLSLKPWFTDVYNGLTLSIAYLAYACGGLWVWRGRRTRIPHVHDEQYRETGEGVRRNEEQPRPVRKDEAHGSRCSTEAAYTEALHAMRSTTYLGLAWQLRGRSLFAVFPELLPYARLPGGAAAGPLARGSCSPMLTAAASGSHLGGEEATTPPSPSQQTLPRRREAVTATHAGPTTACDSGAVAIAASSEREQLHEMMPVTPLCPSKGSASVLHSLSLSPEEPPPIIDTAGAMPRTRPSAASRSDDDDSSSSQLLSRWTPRYAVTPTRDIPPLLERQRQSEAAQLLALNPLHPQYVKGLKQTLRDDECVLWHAKADWKGVVTDIEWLLVDLTAGLLFGVWLIVLSSLTDLKYPLVRHGGSTEVAVCGILCVLCFASLLTSTVLGCRRLYVLTNERLLTLYIGITGPVVTSTDLAAVRYAVLYGYSASWWFVLFPFVALAEWLVPCAPPPTGRTNAAKDGAPSDLPSAKRSEQGAAAPLPARRGWRRAVINFSWEVPSTERKLPPIKSHRFSGMTDIPNFLEHFRLGTSALAQTAAGGGVAAAATLACPSDLRHRLSQSRALERQAWRQHVLLCTGALIASPILTVYPTAVPVYLSIWLLLLLLLVLLSTIQRGVCAHAVTSVPIDRHTARPEDAPTAAGSRDFPDRSPLPQGPRAHTDFSHHYTTSALTSGGSGASPCSSDRGHDSHSGADMGSNSLRSSTSVQPSSSAAVGVGPLSNPHIEVLVPGLLERGMEVYHPLVGAWNGGSPPHAESSAETSRHVVVLASEGLPALEVPTASSSCTTHLHDTRLQAGYDGSTRSPFKSLRETGAAAETTGCSSPSPDLPRHAPVDEELQESRG